MNTKAEINTDLIKQYSELVVQSQVNPLLEELEKQGLYSKESPIVGSSPIPGVQNIDFSGITFDENLAAWYVRIPKKVIDSVSGVGDFAIAVGGLVATIVAVSGGTLAVAAPILVAFITASWAAMKLLCNDNGVVIGIWKIGTIPFMLPG